VEIIMDGLILLLVHKNQINSMQRGKTMPKYIV